MTAQLVGRYQLLDLLGQGAMGKVYLAFDPALDRQVALKTITLPGSDEIRRFRREVQVAARLNHPHIVSIYDVGLEHDPPYVVMELLTGGTLEHHLKGRRLNWSEAMALMQPLCQALAHAHQAGIIHRDVKPANILFGGGQERLLKLADFGLARRQGSERLTGSGGVLGTLAYMSPEQANGEELDAATDLFALGLILFESIAGYNPMRGQSVSETLARVASYEPVDFTPLEGKVPRAALAIIQKTLAKDRRERYSDSRLLEQEIAYTMGQTIRVEPARIVGVTSGRELHIENTAGLAWPPGAVEILRTMFAGYGRLTIKTELLGGRSGSRIFLVRPVRHDGTPELPAVVKMAPLHLIQQEWRAYQDYVRAQLAGVAEIQGEPVMTAAGRPGSGWGGLRYPLVGGGDFEIETLYHYCRRANLADIRYLLEQRLFRRMGEKWRHNFAAAEFRLGDSYDTVLPINLLIQPVEPLSDATFHLVRAGAAADLALEAGDYVRVRGFVVTEIDETGRVVTLDRPAGNQLRFYPSCRLRLQPIAEEEPYQAGQFLEAEGIVTATRLDLLHSHAQETLGPTPFDLGGDVLPNGWPNPLARLPAILSETMSVRTANIHGDFNLDNILVDPATREIYLIDFALARRDHVLHDLLRLEKDIITRLLPDALAQAGLSPQALDSLFQWVDQTVLQERPPAALPHPALEKPLTIIVLIRRAARDLLFDSHQWQEYHQGLTLYLLGALKFKDLDRQARETAFWAAAAIQHLLTQPVTTTIEAAVPAQPALPPAQKRRLWSWPVALLIPLVLVLTAWALWRFAFQAPPTRGPQLASLLSFTPKVEVRQANSDRLQVAIVGMPLYAGDVVYTDDKATARIWCIIGRGPVFEMPPGDNLTIKCEDNGDPRIIDYIDPALARLPTALPATPDNQTPLTDQENLPLLLSPRNTAIVESRPAFRWQPVAGVDRYRLTVSQAGGQLWQQETSQANLLYPADAPPLSPGSTNTVTVEALGTIIAADESYLRVLNSDEVAALAAAEAALLDGGQDEVGQAQILILLYQTHGLSAAAIEQLERLTTGTGINSFYLWKQLGDLYASVGLRTQAEASYQAALAAAEISQNAAVQASPTPQPTASNTPRPTATATATTTPSPSPAPVVTLPVRPGTAVPQPLPVIKPANAAQVVSLARWGQGQVSEVAFAPDGRVLAVASANGVSLYSTLNLAEERSISIPAGVNSVAFSPNGQTLAAGSADRLIRLWQLADGALLATLDAHEDQVWSVAFSPNGQILASGSLDHTVRLWQVADGALLATLDEHSGPVRSVAFSPDGQTLATASADNTIRLWQVSDGRLLQTLTGHTDEVRSVTFAPNGQTLASGSDDGTVRLWAAADGRLIDTFRGDGRSVFSVAFAPDGQTLASTSAGNTIWLWQVNNGADLATLAGHQGWVLAVAFSPDGRLLASGSYDGLRLWGIPPSP